MEIKARTPQVLGRLNYLLPQPEKPFNYMYEPAPGVEASNCRYDAAPCAIADARQAAVRPALATHGFELFGEPSAVTDFYDPDQVTGLYYREVERMACRLMGGRRAIVFDHQLRQREAGRPALSFGRPGDGSQAGAVGRVHNDYSERSGRARLGKVLPGTEGDLPFAILNFWRPVLYPAIDTPLSVCDARSVDAGDWVAADIFYRDRAGEIFLATRSARHRWYFYPEMQTDEVLVFKQFDSRPDAPARMVPHCAFEPPGTPPHVPLRRSIEVRCLVLLD